jgi:sugar (pentulose or hexulose) kinase
MAPGDMPVRIREYCEETGQGAIPDDASLVRCIYDSLSLCFRSKLEELQKVSGVKYEILNIVGGGTQAKILMKLASDCLGIPVLAGPVEATAIGNVLSQAMADGQVRSLEEAREIVRNSFAPDEYQPEKGSGKSWDEAFRVFESFPD